jgi:ABC-type nickel/cobalt efflux system permease component RcnA
VALFTASWITKNTKRSNALEICSIILIIMIGLVLIYTTVAPPKISPLLDSNTNTYGIYKLPSN